jgi:chromosome segregation ATPase
LADVIGDRDKFKKDLEEQKRKGNGIPQAERDKLHESLGAEKNKVSNLTRERDQARTERNDEREEKEMALEKIEDLIECFFEYKACRQCYWNFGVWVEDDGDRLLVRCNHCRTRHWH